MAGKHVAPQTDTSLEDSIREDKDYENRVIAGESWAHRYADED